MRYKVLEILHSGRKGIRQTPVDDPKYDGVVDSIIDMPLLESLNPFEELAWDFVETTSEYEWWHTSSILGIKKYDDIYEIETVNTIYLLQRLGE